jgi:hypothetical protein
VGAGTPKSKRRPQPWRSKQRYVRAAGVRRGASYGAPAVGWTTFQGCLRYGPATDAAYGLLHRVLQSGISPMCTQPGITDLASLSLEAGVHGAVEACSTLGVESLMVWSRLI